MIRRNKKGQFTRAAFESIADLGTGVINVSWEIVE